MVGISVLAFLSEVGTDVGKFATAEHFGSRLGLCPIGVRLGEVKFPYSGRLLVFLGAISGDVSRSDHDSPVALEGVQGALQCCRSQQSLALTLSTG